jgi:hypothetical protein
MASQLVADAFEKVVWRRTEDERGRTEDEEWKSQAMLKRGWNEV